MNLNIKKLILLSILLFSGFLTFKFSFSHLFGYKKTGLGTVLNSPKADILIIGSTHVRFSYDTKLMEKKCGCSVQAVSYSYLNYPLIFDILEFLKGEDKLPKQKLIIDHYALLFFKNREFVDTRLFFEAPPNLKFKILRYMKNKLTSLGLKDFYRFIVTSENELMINYLWNRPLVDKRDYNGSYQAKKIRGVDQKKYETFKVSDLSFDFKNFNEYDFKQMIKINNDFKSAYYQIYFVETPLPPTVWKNSKLVKFRESYHQKLAKNQIKLIDSNYDYELMELEAKSFMDENHLSTSGREKFSKYFILKIFEEF